MKSVFCNTPYHQQDRSTFCGPAVAEMLLAKFGPRTLDQLEIARESSEPVGDVGISPDGMVQALTAKRPTGFDSRFIAYPDSDREAGIKRIVDALFATRLPVPALVFGTDPHWLLVTGAVIDDAPRPGGGFELHGFYVANPAPVTASQIDDGTPSQYPTPPPPHGDRDGCGDGGLQGGRYAYVSAASWRRHHWPLPEPGKRARPFVSITTTHVPSQAELLAAGIEAIAPPLTATSPIANGNAALPAAKVAVQGSGIDASQPFKSAFAGAEPGQATEHDILGATPEKWYLVTFARNHDAVGVAFVDAASGQLMGAMAPPTVVFTDLELRQFVAAQFELHSHEFAHIIDGRKITPDDVHIDPVRFWQPCYESTSPFYSFAIAHVRGRKLFVLPHVRIYTALHPTRCTPAAERPGPLGFIVYRSAR